MKHEDFYSGEAVQSASPPNFSERKAEAEAAQQASFGAYYYDPGNRAMMNNYVAPAPIINPGGYGYNVPMYSPQVPNPVFMNPPQQPAYGLGTPYRYDNMMYPYYPNQQYMQPQMPQQPTEMFIPGVNPSGNDYLPPLNYEEVLDDLQTEFWVKQQEVEAKQQVDRQYSSYNNPYGNSFGFNYYGMPYYNPYQYNSINAELSEKIKDIQNQAKEARFNLNMQLARLAHNIAKEPISDEELNKRYTGYTVQIPQSITWSPQEYYDQIKYERMVPFNNAQVYRDHFNKVSREFSEIIPKDSDLKETFMNMGVLESKWEMEEEMHRRKDGTSMYNNTGYKYFVRKKAAERYARSKGLNPNNVQINTSDLRSNSLQQFPTLSQNAHVSEDGTLHVTCNFGSHAGETYSIHNSQESEYNEKRERFNRFIDTIPGSIYLNNQGG